MAFVDFGKDALNQFQIGFQAGGTNPIAGAIHQVVDRANQIGLLGAQANANVYQAVQTERQTIEPKIELFRREYEERQRLMQNDPMAQAWMRSQGAGSPALDMTAPVDAPLATERNAGQTQAASGMDTTSAASPLNALMAQARQSPALPPPGYTGGEYDPWTHKMTRRFGETPTGALQRKTAEEQQKESLTASGDMLSVHNALRGLISQFKALQEASGGTGRSQIAKHYVSEKFGEYASNVPGVNAPVNPEVTAYQTARRNTAVEFARLISGTTRGQQGLMGMILKTLPDENSTNPEFESKTRAELHGAMGRYFGRLHREYTPAMQTQVNAIFDDLLQKTASVPLPQGISSRPMSPGNTNPFRRRVHLDEHGLPEGSEVINE